MIRYPHLRFFFRINSFNVVVGSCPWFSNFAQNWFWWQVIFVQFLEWSYPSLEHTYPFCDTRWYCCRQESSLRPLLLLRTGRLVTSRYQSQRDGRPATLARSWTDAPTPPPPKGRVTPMRRITQTRPGDRRPAVRRRPAGGAGGAAGRRRSRRAALGRSALPAALPSGHRRQLSRRL